MHVWRRVRGLLGSVLTWGTVGAALGAAIFVLRFRPWSGTPIPAARLVSLSGTFLAGGAVWGAACGLAFGLAVWAIGRRREWAAISPRRFTFWGAVAGAAFPLLIYTPVVLWRGEFAAIPYFSMITGLSALTGAACARTVFAMVRRAPTAAFGQPGLRASIPDSFGEVAHEVVRRERREVR